MCKSSVTETPEARNRRLFLAALRSGIQVQPGATEGLSWVGSKSGGAPHLVETYITDGVRTEFCRCEWGRKEGRIVTEGLHSGHARKTGRPCSHILLCRWYALDTDQQAAICDTNPDIDAAVQVAAASALVAPAPLVVAPTRRRERSQEAW